MRPSLIDALKNLVPDASVSVSVTDGQETITWHDPKISPVTDEQIEAELKRLQQEYDNKEYQRLRAAEYPSIGDQLDALFHAGIFPAEMAALLQAVKDKYPKPN